MRKHHHQVPISCFNNLSLATLVQLDIKQIFAVLGQRQTINLRSLLKEPFGGLLLQNTAHAGTNSMTDCVRWINVSQRRSKRTSNVFTPNERASEWRWSSQQLMKVQASSANKVSPPQDDDQFDSLYTSTPAELLRRPMNFGVDLLQATGCLSKSGLLMSFVAMLMVWPNPE